MEPQQPDPPQLEGHRCTCEGNDCDHDPGKCQRRAELIYEPPNGGGGTYRIICLQCRRFERQAEQERDYS